MNIHMNINLHQKNDNNIYNKPITSEIYAVALLYLVQGFFGISKLAISFYYKDILHLSPFHLTVVTSITAIPWIIKPLYGFISDTFPLFGYKRNSYLILSSLLSALSWAIMAISFSPLGQSQIQTDGGIITMFYSVFMITLSFLGLTFSDVLLDAIVVSKSRELNIKGSLQTICWISSSIGGIIGSYLSGYLLQKYGTNFIFYLTSVLPLITIGITIFIKEKKVKPFNYKSQYSRIYTMQLLKIKIKKIFDTLSQKAILYPLLFLMISNITPTIGITLFYFEINKLGFQPEFFGKLGLASSISSLLGILLYNQKLKSISPRNILKWTCIIGAVLGLSPLILVTHVNRLIGIPDLWIAILDDITISIFYQITIIPILVIAAQTCPSGIEAMLFATIMSANNLSNNIGRLNGALLTQMMGVTNDNFINLSWLIVLSNLLGLAPLIFLHLIPDKK